MDLHVFMATLHVAREGKGLLAARARSRFSWCAEAVHVGVDEPHGCRAPRIGSLSSLLLKSLLLRPVESLERAAGESTR